MEAIYKAFCSFVLLLCLMFSFAGCRVELEDDSNAITETVDFDISDRNDGEISCLQNESSVSEDDLSEINAFREDFDLGTCRRLWGDVSNILFYMDDFESEWTEAETENFTENEITPGLEFLESEAKKYGIELNLNIKKVYRSIYYDDEVIISVKDAGLASIDVLTQASREVGYNDTESMIEQFRDTYQTDEVVCFTIFNKNGTAYAINPKREETLRVDEHCIVFARDLYSDEADPIGSQASIAAHEMLHLFGAEDYYASSSRKKLAQKHYNNDIMLGANYYIGTNNVGDATAFYIGWTDNIPDVLYDENW